MAPRSALAVPVNDSEALAKRNCRVTENSVRREALALAAQEFARTYNADWTVAQFEEIYRKSCPTMIEAASARRGLAAPARVKGMSRKREAA